jgi:hypothetical protein
MYKTKIQDAIKELLSEYECQPILFVGSGFSKRYFNGPNWADLLKFGFASLADGASSFDYFRQKHDDDLALVGTALSEKVFEWAWKEGRSFFPAEYFESRTNKDSFVKFLLCDHMRKITPEISKVGDEHKNEIKRLTEIRPHAIITTNYDLFLENVFEGYEPITGQKILKYNTNSFGEIYHIHGDVSEPESVVLTKSDYDEWKEKKKYISAKLLTYFAEHPVFIFGYGLGDQGNRMNAKRR